MTAKQVQIGDRTCHIYGTDRTEILLLQMTDEHELQHMDNSTMAVVGNNIRDLHRELTEQGKDCTLEWNSGGHFKEAALRTARAFRWVMEEYT